MDAGFEFRKIGASYVIPRNLFVGLILIGRVPLGFSFIAPDFSKEFNWHLMFMLPARLSSSYMLAYTQPLQRLAVFSFLRCFIVLNLFITAVSIPCLMTFLKKAILLSMKFSRRPAGDFEV